MTRIVRALVGRARLAVRLALGRVMRLVEPTLAVRRWEREGRPVPPPPPAKIRELRRYARTYRLRTFVETGTFFGDTTAALARNVHRVVTMELSPDLAERARRRFAHDPKVTVLEGDSGALLPGVLSELAVPALFWLDGHYSAGITARGAEDTPVRTELTAILAHPVRQHVIMIDDAREFTGGVYPTVEELREQVRAAGDPYAVEVRDDIIRLTPRNRGIARAAR